MTQQWQGPPGPQHPPGRTSSSTTVWWVLIGVAALALVAVVVWVVVSMSSGPDAPNPDPTVSTATSPTETEPTKTEPTETEPTDDWGGFPPANPDSLRDFRDPQYPEVLGSFSLDRVHDDAMGFDAGYMDIEAGTALSALVELDRGQYASRLGSLENVAYIGLAVCGTEVTETGREANECLMAGETVFLSVSTVSDGITLDDVAELTQELYQQL